MSIDPKYIPVVIAAWLIFIASSIIARLIKKKNVSTNATNADIVNAIYNTHSSLQNTMYVAVGILIAVILSRK